MLRLLVILLLAGASSGLLAEEQYASISGRVFEAATGKPVAGARVGLFHESQDPRDPLYAFSGEDGTYVLASVEPGPYALSARRSGYVVEHYGSHPAGWFPVITLRPGDTRTGIDFSLTRHAVVHGRVTDPEGEPLPRVYVSAMRWWHFQGRRWLRTEGGAETDDLGEYRIFGLKAGAYRIMAAPQSGAEFGQDLAIPPDEVLLATFHSSTREASEAAVVHLAAGGEEIRADIQMVRRKGVRVSGWVKLPDQTAFNPSITLVSRDQQAVSTRFSTHSGQDGKFAFRSVPPGTYRLHTQVPGRNLFASRSVEVSYSDVDGIELTPSPPMTVTGRVRMEGDPDADLTGVRVVLFPQAAGAQRFAGAATVDGAGVVSANGQFSYCCLVPDVYLLSVAFDKPEQYVKSAHAGARTLADFRLDLTSGEPPPLEVVIRPKGATLTGTVTGANQKPLARAVVVLLPVGSRAHIRYRIALVWEDGEFDLRGIAPGEYRLLAFEMLEEGAYLSDEAMAPYLDEALRITLEEDSVETRTLTALPQPEILDRW